MKKFIIAVSILVLLAIAFDMVCYRTHFYMDLSPQAPVETFVRAEGETLLLDSGSGYQPFTVKGVNMGSGQPGQWSTDYSIDEETYSRWFAAMQEMGANTLRIYTVQSPAFYNAFYAYNKDNPNPLWLIHGVWLNDYILNSHRDAYHEDFYGTFLRNCKTMVDVIHGRQKIKLSYGASSGHGSYLKDISPWVIGYILGVEWEDVTVAYTDEKYRDNPEYNSYHGKYLTTSADATPFEAMLARVGDGVIAYESARYKQQRLVAFSNWATTDPFVYPENVIQHFQKCARVDVEHILGTAEFLSGQFASYHIYPYYPDYMNYVDNWSVYGLNRQKFITETGAVNTYRAYLSMLNNHHSMPVVISEFGVSTGRGIAQLDSNTGRHQGHMSEKDQGYALISCYEDIMSAGSAGGCVFSWQDEWFKRTWNTMHAVNLMHTPYWSDYQTNEQYFGLLSFDPGEEASVCYVDGDLSEWAAEDVVWQNKENSLSVKYDERFLYFMIDGGSFDFARDALYMPLDITPKSGSVYCENFNLLFDRAADFIVVIDGEDNSRVLVQERYEALRSTYAESAYGMDTYATGNVPDVDSPLFVPINLILQQNIMQETTEVKMQAELFETGKLRRGSANPTSDNFDSLADFEVNGGCIELKLPWQLLNFADPSRMSVHDDYYDGNYGIDFISINELYTGMRTGTGDEGRIHMTAVPLMGWGNNVTSHQRLKPSYYMLQSAWSEKH